MEQEKRAQSERSQAEFSHASAWLETGDGAEALRELAQSLESNPDNASAATRLINLLGQRQWPHLVAQQNCGLPVGRLKTDGTGSRLVLATRSAGRPGEMHMEKQSIHLYDAETLGDEKSVALECFEIVDLQVSGDRALVIGERPNLAALLDVKTGKVLKNPQAGYGIDFGGAFSSDGSSAIIWATGEPGNSPDAAAGTKLEIVSAADGTTRFPPLANAERVRAVSMNGPELRLLTADGKVTIQPLQTGKTPRARPFPVAAELPNFATFDSDGTAVLGVTRDGVKVWPVSPSDANPADPVEFPSKGLAKFQLDTTDAGKKIACIFREGDESPTFLAQDRWSTSASARSSITQFGQNSEGRPEVTADWQSPFAPIALLDTGLAVAQDTKAFVLPFHGGASSGTLHHETAITAICEIHEGLLATGSEDGAVRLWRLTTPALPAPQETSPAPEKIDDAVLWENRSLGAEIRRGESDDYVLRRGGQSVKIELPAQLLQQSISSFELSRDGEWGIVSGFREDARGGAGSGAWIFRASDGKLLSGKVGPCEWAGFSPDRRQVLTIEFGRLTYWNLGQDEKGTTTFAKAAPQFAQLGLAGAGVAANGQRVVTRSISGDVIVWDKAEGSPLQTLKRDPLWSDVDLDSTEPNASEGVRARTISCAPALDTDGRLLATAYGRAFVVWDVDSGRPLSDPIFCASGIARLEFSATDSTKILAALRDGSIVSWDYTSLGGTLAPADVTTLQKLALAVANDQWVEEAPRLAAETHPPSPVVAKLLEHFAAQARAVQGTAAKSRP